MRGDRDKNHQLGSIERLGRSGPLESTWWAGMEKSTNHDAREQQMEKSTGQKYETVHQGSHDQRFEGWGGDEVSRIGESPSIHIIADHINSSGKRKKGVFWGTKHCMTH